MNERVSHILRHPVTVPVVVGVVSFAGGFGAGYFLAKRNQDVVEEVPFEQMELNFEIDEEAFERLKTRNVQESDEFLASEEDVPRIEFVDPPVPAEVRPDPRDISVDKDVQAIMDKAIEDGEFITTEEAAARNIFAADDDDWNYAEEIEGRSSDKPYVIHKDEFWAEEMDFDQLTLTYYEGDDIMADEMDTPVYNHAEVTGDLKFGHGSGDPNVVYIRNEQRKAEYEILRHEGLFSIEVLGLDIEDNERVKDLKHSNSPRKFRPE